MSSVVCRFPFFFSQAGGVFLNENWGKRNVKKLTQAASSVKVCASRARSKYCWVFPVPLTLFNHMIRKHPGFGLAIIKHLTAAAKFWIYQGIVLPWWIKRACGHCTASGRSARSTAVLAASAASIWVGLPVSPPPPSVFAHPGWAELTLIDASSQFI